jgi:hypothetical protein
MLLDSYKTIRDTNMYDFLKEISIGEMFAARAKAD